MARKGTQTIESKVDVLIDLAQGLLALELSRDGVSHQQIGKRLHIAKAKVVTMLKGAKKGE